MGKQSGSLSKTQFFPLVDQVLIAIGRQALPAGGAQRAVIEVVPSERVLQILAGPGSGKTEMLVWRVLYELLVCGTPPGQIIVTTFTRRAATELQVRVVERCDELLQIAHKNGLALPDPQVHDLRIGTIHSLCDGLLAEFDAAYVEAGTQLIDETELMIRLARHHRFALGRAAAGAAPRVVDRLLANQSVVALFRPPWEDATWPSANMEVCAVLAGVLAQHTETWIPRCAPANLPNGIQVLHGPPSLTADLVKMHTRWETYLDQNNLLDFATVQKRFWDKQPGMLPHFTHVFVDEFQDSNPIQFAIHTKWLTGAAARLTVVGDDDQAIYRFRGSDIGCFQGLEPFCKKQKVTYRRETLDVNYRSTRAIVSFCQAFRAGTVLQKLSMPKTVVAPKNAAVGQSVRLLEGAWPKVCAAVAAELDRLGVGRIPKPGNALDSAALLLFSTSEREYRQYRSPALALRNAVEAGGRMRVYNPRNKMAATAESPVSMLLGLISYLIDPITRQPAGVRGRLVEVWACCPNLAHRGFARSAAPQYGCNQKHIDCQKKFFKADGGAVSAPSLARQPLVQFVDQIRNELVAASAAGKQPRLTVAGFVSRLLADPFFRSSGFTVNLFRQALFTTLLEANIAPTRLSQDSLDQPLECQMVGGKFAWPKRFWDLLNHFGAYLDNAKLDDPEVESFEENAVLMITFHQAKGLEFDHVYVSGTGRQPDVSPALRTRLYSGDAVPYSLNPLSVPETKDKQTLNLALADREREVYVAMTRARKTLTVLHDPSNLSPFMPLNPAIAAIFAKLKGKPHPDVAAVTVKEAIP